MLYFQGKNALTTYRQQALILQLKKISPSIKSIKVSYGYFVETQHDLSVEDSQKLQTLLANAPLATLPVPSTDFECWVVPRLGTISPWSSKATEIAKICGLQQVSRLERGIHYGISGVNVDQLTELMRALHDPLTESLLLSNAELTSLFQHQVPVPLCTVDVMQEGVNALQKINQSLGLALSDREIDYLFSYYKKIERNPSDVELMMFAQVNSEHCRHKIFNANWVIDHVKKDHSLFSMIRHTHQENPQAVLVAYNDNAAVMRAGVAEHFLIDPTNQQYHYVKEESPFLLKVETHNHPTAISPAPGAATGSGGEIRDEAATGCGSKAKAGLCGFSVSHLRIPSLIQPWETCIGKPSHLASALEIMLQGPIGAASFNNEFGRPNILGYFRSCQMLLVSQYGEVCRGYHKPIMIAGGIGSIRPTHVHKKQLTPAALLIVLGGPAMAIGLGGGSLSSRTQEGSAEALDFASVQRANPEMQRRAQEVINTCCALGEENPILSIHDVGAGGLSNALPELVDGSELGGTFELRAIPNAEPGMSPLAIWCNEAQERYVLSIDAESLPQFSAIAERERCLFAVVGEATEQRDLLVNDQHFKNEPVDLPMAVLFEDLPALEKADQHAAPSHSEFDTKKVELADAIKRVLQFPCVANKNFLITIGDRSVGGLVARDQMVGPWQVPVADVAVTHKSFIGYAGEAMAMGERAPIALLHHAASARMAVGEAITNIAAAAIDDLGDIVLSANWMAAADYPGEGAGLYDAVQTIAMELCPSLDIAIPVGKDSLSMRTAWTERGQNTTVTAPLSLIITAAANVSDVRATLTPELKTDTSSKLLFIDLGQGANLLGASVLCQVYNEIGQRPPDVDHPQLLRSFFEAIQTLNRRQLLLAYHDRSDGGLLATLTEMMFAAHVGATIYLDDLGDDPIASLFCEELGALIQVSSAHLEVVLDTLRQHGLGNCSHVIGELNDKDQLEIYYDQRCLYENARVELQRWWSETSFHLQAMRDNPACAQQEFDQLLESNDPGLSCKTNFDFHSIDVKVGDKPQVAILREQGVNGHVEMAAAFDRVGFRSVDVHMSDLIAGRRNLDEFVGMVACGGFSYGDVLGAGRGWAQSILMHANVREMFQHFFNRTNTFALGVCNGCQMLAQLKEIIPGADHWPVFSRNVSEQFEARLVAVKIPESPSIFFKGMADSILPVVVAHGEGLASFAHAADAKYLKKHNLVALQYVDHFHQVTERYPYNPNGSVNGITGLTTEDGRVTIMMPHPERVFRTTQLSWHPAEWGENSPWLKMFANARAWLAENF